MTSVTIEVDDDMFEALQEFAKETDTNVEQAIVDILEVGLFEHEDESEVVNED